MSWTGPYTAGLRYGEAVEWMGLEAGFGACLAFVSAMIAMLFERRLSLILMFLRDLISSRCAAVAANRRESHFCLVDA